MEHVSKTAGPIYDTHIMEAARLPPIILTVRVLWTVAGFLDQDTDNWYFLSNVHDGWFGRMTKGWHYDDDDGRWYYLSPFTGVMLMGWQKIDGIWYYLTADSQQKTWTFNEGSKRWEYTNQNGRPLGSLYINEMTPDGYQVDENGAWTRETP